MPSHIVTLCDSIQIFFKFSAYTDSTKKYVHESPSSIEHFFDKFCVSFGLFHNLRDEKS